MDENKALAEGIGRLQDEMSYRGKAYQQLITDKDGKARWEDQLVYDNRIEISWDGDTTGRVNFTDSQMSIYYKVSDLTPGKEEIIGGTIKFGRDDPVVIIQEGTYDIGDGAYIIGPRGEIIVSFVDNLEVQDASIIPERGTYMRYDEMVPGYVSSLTYGKIKQLDKKFLPPASNQLLNAVFIRLDGDKSSIYCNLTYEQIREQIENDLPIVAIYKLSESNSFLITKYELDVDSISFWTAGDSQYVLIYNSDGTLKDCTPS